MLANGTLVLGNIVLCGEQAHLSQRCAPLHLKCHFTVKNFYTISTDTHIDNLVIPPTTVPGGAHKNTAGTVRFEALLNQDLLVASGNAVGNHPG